MEITVVNKKISINPAAKRISITSTGKNISLVNGLNVVYRYYNAANVLIHYLSQVDIDNKYISASELNTLNDKRKAVVFLEEIGIELAYEHDYEIVNDRISWSGLQLEGILMVNDKLKIIF